EQTWDFKADFEDAGIYRPDFSLLVHGKDVIIEHSAFDPDDSRAVLPANSSTTADSYRKQIHLKRQFWSQKGIQLIETNATMLAGGREAFEQQLALILNRAGMTCRRLPKAEIVKRVFDLDFTLTRISGLFLQFIQHAKKKCMAPDRLAQYL